MYPKLKAHLDRFKSIITSDNKPYGLHRARTEDFFKGEKIISLRKCQRPSFAFTDFDCYVSQTHSSIKTERFNLKFLTAVLNSQLIEFWLRYMGKMQGDLYQIDKEPLLNVPLIEPDDATPFIKCVESMIELNSELSIVSNRFRELIMSEFDLNRWSPKLADWWLGTFDSFVKTIKSKLTLSQKDELLSVYADYQSKLMEIHQKIRYTDETINTLVYKLYQMDKLDISTIQESLA